MARANCEQPNYQYQQNCPEYCWWDDLYSNCSGNYPPEHVDEAAKRLHQAGFPEDGGRALIADARARAARGDYTAAAAPAAPAYAPPAYAPPAHEVIEITSDDDDDDVQATTPETICEQQREQGLTRCSACQGETDRYTMSAIPPGEGVCVDRRCYKAGTLRLILDNRSQVPQVPHNGRQFTQHELDTALRGPDCSGRGGRKIRKTRKRKYKKKKTRKPRKNKKRKTRKK